LTSACWQMKNAVVFFRKLWRDYTFAFDNIADYDLIHQSCKYIVDHTKVRVIKFYVLVGFESTNEIDIENAFRRIELLMRYQCLPYIMRYQTRIILLETVWIQRKYIAMARWGNQPSIFQENEF
jgi:hypothetical protein